MWVALMYTFTGCNVSLILCYIIGVFTSAFVRWLPNKRREATHWLRRLPWERLELWSQVRKTLHTCISLGYILYQLSCPTEPPSVELKLPSQEAQVATTLWNSSSSISLNPYQRRAVELALSNKFVMIQGPPGMKVDSLLLFCCCTNPLLPYIYM